MRIERLDGLRALAITLLGFYNRILRWLWPSHYAPYVNCEWCGRIGRKTEMVHDPTLAYYCIEQEACEA
jgi:hypothetical protein